MDFPKFLPSKFVTSIRRRSTEGHPAFSFFKPGLSFKLLLVAVGVSLAGVLVSSFLALIYERHQLVNNAQAATTRLSNAVEASLEHAMLSNDRAMAGEIVQSIVDGEGIETIRILDARGVVRISSTAVDIGERFDRSESACQFCHADRVAPDSKSAIRTSKVGHEVLLNVNLIRNQPRCAGCHDAQTEILGLLMIETPLTDLRSQLAARLWAIGLLALATSVVLVGLMLLALKKFVIRPVSELSRGAAKIGAGNMDYQMQVTSRDELGELAHAFDSMRQQLRDSYTEMERRNRELSVLNEVALSASQLQDLQQILDLAIDTVVNRLGMRAGTVFLFDEDEGRLTLRAYRGLSEAQCQEIERLRQQPSGDLSDQVAHAGEAIFVPDMAAEERFQRLWDDLSGRSYVNIPLKSKSRVVGTMGLVTYARQPLSQREVAVLETVGHEIGIAIDNASLLAETRRQEQKTMTLYRLGMRISASLELRRILNAVAEGARQVLAADIGVVGMLDEKHRQVSVKAAAGTRTEALKGLTVPVRGEVPGSALASGRPLIVEEFAPDLLTSHDSDLIAAEGVVSILAVPLQRGGDLLGLVGVMTRQRRGFSQDDVQLLTRLAHQVAVAIENARLYEQVRHLATLEERDRLAQELHDYLAQTLGYLNVKASVTGELLSGGQLDQAQASLLELKGVAKEVYTEVRETIFSLRTAASPELGLLPTLREYLNEYRVDYDLDTRLVADTDEIQLSPEVEAQVFRIIQEALTNVRKHAQASRAWIRFEPGGALLGITIEDDGQGFDPDQATWDSQRHFGLQIMRERARNLGGSLELDSQPGKGTRVLIRVPLASEVGGV
jgi:nitrate/nitrite-specific signal transduction histidine kinase